MKREQINIGRRLKRLTGHDVLVAKQALRSISISCLPDGQTQRRAFFKLVPVIYLMRNKLGLTFKQVAQICNHNGFSLSPSTVRAYYAHFLPQLKTECEELSQAIIAAEQYMDDTSPYIVSPDICLSVVEEFYAKTRL